MQSITEWVLPPQIVVLWVAEKLLERVSKWSHLQISIHMHTKGELGVKGGINTILILIKCRRFFLFLLRYLTFGSNIISYFYKI